MNRRLFVLAALALAGCATLPPRIMPPSGAGFEELEPLELVRAGPETLTIRVVSHGCTAKADFAFFVQRSGGAVQLAFGRRKIDVCKGPASAMDLAFTWAELGVAPATPVFLLNPLAPGAGARPRPGTGE
jgi:hypothetical protein